MAGLQRSQVSFRRQGSSGLVWDDKLLTAELNKTHNQDQDQDQDQEQTKQFQDQEIKTDATAGADFKPPRNIQPINTFERSRSTGGGRGYRTGKVSPAIEPPSPRLSACGCCSGFGNQIKKPPKAKTRRARTGKPRSR